MLGHTVGGDILTQPLTSPTLHLCSYFSLSQPAHSIYKQDTHIVFKVHIVHSCIPQLLSLPITSSSLQIPVSSCHSIFSLSLLVTPFSSDPITASSLPVCFLSQPPLLVSCHSLFFSCLRVTASFSLLFFSQPPFLLSPLFTASSSLLSSHDSLFSCPRDVSSLTYLLSFNYSPDSQEVVNHRGGSNGSGCSCGEKETWD